MVASALHRSTFVAVHLTLVTSLDGSEVIEWDAIQARKLTTKYCQIVKHLLINDITDERKAGVSVMTWKHFSTKVPRTNNKNRS